MSHPNGAHVAEVVGVAAGITFALRALPFAIVSRLRSANRFREVGGLMPAGLMIILLLFLLKPSSSTPDTAIRCGAVAFTAVLQWSRSNTLLSVTAGTTCFLLLQSLTT